MLRKVSTLVVLGMTIFAFQNCGQVAFKSQDLNGVLAAKSAPPASGSIIEEDPSSKTDDDQGEEHFICVLEGEGQSVRLGYADKNLVEKKGALQDVCMSRYACEEIVSKAFKVKFAKREGFCVQQAPNNVPLSDEKLDAMVDEILANK